VLVHLIELSAEPGREPLRDFDDSNGELAGYSEELTGRPQIVVLTKMDVTETREAYPALREAFAARGIELGKISGATGEGVGAVLEKVWKALGRK
jgi:GTP-binding protein